VNSCNSTGVCPGNTSQGRVNDHGKLPHNLTMKHFCAEVTTVSFTIKKKFIKKIDESKYSKNRVTYVSVIPIDL